jgi:cytochrome c oxidase assembly protein subunit 17
MLFCRCCACPETKKARDDCFLMYGSNIDEDSESKAKCKDIVQRHRECMANLGFKV